jgi:GTP cyclohydrolase IA
VAQTREHPLNGADANKGKIKKETTVMKKVVESQEQKEQAVERHARAILEYIGENPKREGLVETPKRMRRAWEEIMAGYKTDPKSLVKTFTQGTCREMVILKNAEFYSTCEHHFFPFFGHCSIGYVPRDKVIGVSKLARLLDCYSRRMQIQERMTSQIADFLEKELGALGVYVVCEGVHFCMTSRGVRKQDASMVTSAIRGEFKQNAAMRAEFLSLIGK